MWAISWQTPLLHSTARSTRTGWLNLTTLQCTTHTRLSAEAERDCAIQNRARENTGCKVRPTRRSNHTVSQVVFLVLFLSMDQMSRLLLCKANHLHRNTLLFKFRTRAPNRFILMARARTSKVRMTWLASFLLEIIDTPVLDRNGLQFIMNGLALYTALEPHVRQWVHGGIPSTSTSKRNLPKKM